MENTGGLHNLDMISRQAVLDMLEDINNHIIDGYGYKHDWCVEWVKGLPSIDAGQYTDDEIQRMQDIEQAQIEKAYDLGYAEGKADAEPQWIPCSERLPETEVEALCCDNQGNMIIGHPYVDKESWTGYSAEGDDDYLCSCLAWMPLPEPVRGEKNVKVR